MQAGDVRYRASTEETRLLAGPLLPFDPARNLLGIDDDVDLREAVARFVSRDSDPVISIPSSLSGAARRRPRLEALVATADDATRSRAASLLGGRGSPTSSTRREREALLSSTVSNLQLALDFDPTNDEPKYNLELAYQRGRIQLSEAAAGTDPSPGGQGSKGAGAGEPGTGY